MFYGIPISTFSASALLGIVVVLILTGRLIPRISLLDKAKEADRWREAYEKERDARNLSDAQTKELLEIAKTSHAVISAIYASTSEHVRGGPANDALQEG